jgi:hypothetical protein
LLIAVFLTRHERIVSLPPMKTANSRKSKRGARASSDPVAHGHKVDFAARLRAIYGTGVLKQTATELLAIERGER